MGGLALAPEQLALAAQRRQLGLLLAALLLLRAQIVLQTIDLHGQPFLGQACLAQALFQQQTLGGLAGLGTLEIPGQHGQRCGTQQQAEEQIGRIENEGKGHGIDSRAMGKLPGSIPARGSGVEALQQPSGFVRALGGGGLQPVAGLQRLALARLAVVPAEFQLGAQVAGTRGLAQQLQADAPIAGAPQSRHSNWPRRLWAMTTPWRAGCLSRRPARRLTLA